MEDKIRTCNSGSAIKRSIWLGGPYAPFYFMHTNPIASEIMANFQPVSLDRQAFKKKLLISIWESYIIMLDVAAHFTKLEITGQIAVGKSGLWLDDVSDNDAVSVPISIWGAGNDVALCGNARLKVDCTGVRI